MLPSVPAPFPQGIFPSLTLISNQSHSLHGTGTGNYIGRTLIVDAGLFDTLSGIAHLTGLGSFEIAGWLQGVGLVAHGRETGRLELSGPNGSLTLKLQGRVEQSFSTLPPKFVYAVSHGTGEFEHWHSAGFLRVELIPAPTAFGLPPQGRFNLSFC